MSLAEQLANVGAEVGRMVKWKKSNRNDLSRFAGERALELLWLSIDDSRNHMGVKELTRIYEFIADYLVGDDQYQVGSEAFQKYFADFNIAARLGR